MNRKRIETAVKYLRSIPAHVADRHVDMYTWYDNKKETHEGFVKPKSANEVANTCGYTACAAGWLTLVPVLNKQGLKMSHGAYPVPKFKLNFGLYALVVFFNISERDADLIFVSPSKHVGYEALDEVCRKLEYLLTGGNLLDMGREEE